MTDDLLHALGRHQREDLARESAAPADDELGRPFDEGERAAILDGLFDRLDAEAPEPELDAAPPPAGAPEPEPEPEPEAGKVVELDSRRRRSMILGTVLSAAAAIALIWLGRSLLEPDPATRVATIPEYTITSVEGGRALQRSAPRELEAGEVPTLELRAEDEIDWVFTPSEPVDVPIAVAARVRSDTDQLEFIARLEAETSGPGAVRLRGPLSNYFELEPGSWTIELLVAEPGQLPRDLEHSESGPWRSLEVRVNIVAE